MWVLQDQHFIYMIQPGDKMLAPDGSDMGLVPGEDMLRLTYASRDDKSCIAYMYLCRRVAYLDESGSLVKTKYFDDLARAASQSDCCIRPKVAHHIAGLQAFTLAPMPKDHRASSFVLPSRPKPQSLLLRTRACADRVHSRRRRSGSAPAPSGAWRLMTPLRPASRLSTAPCAPHWAVAVRRSPPAAGASAASEKAPRLAPRRRRRTADPVARPRRARIGPRHRRPVPRPCRRPLRMWCEGLAGLGHARADAEGTIAR